MDELKKRIKKTGSKVLKAGEEEKDHQKNFRKNIDNALKLNFLEEEELNRIEKIRDFIKKNEIQEDI